MCAGALFLEDDSLVRLSPVSLPSLLVCKQNRAMRACLPQAASVFCGSTAEVWQPGVCLDISQLFSTCRHQAGQLHQSAEKQDNNTLVAACPSPRPSCQHLIVSKMAMLSHWPPQDRPHRYLSCRLSDNLAAPTHTGGHPTLQGKRAP